jgi:hypothetical protein
MSLLDIQRVQPRGDVFCIAPVKIRAVDAGFWSGAAIAAPGRSQHTVMRLEPVDLWPEFIVPGAKPAVKQYDDG